MNNTQMKRIENEGQLVALLGADIASCGKKEVVFFAGHFPLIYENDQKERTAEPGIRTWGEFSAYTLELAATLAEQAKLLGIESKFALICDDHTYCPQSVPYGIRKKRDRFYNAFSGRDAKLHQEFGQILAKRGFSEDDVIKQDQHKPGREDCLYISENVLIAERMQRQHGIPDNGCAKAYKEFVESDKYFDKKNQYLVAFVPHRCMGNVCGKVLDQTPEVNASHVFTSTEYMFTAHCAKMTADQLYSEEGVFYRKDYT